MICFRSIDLKILVAYSSVVHMSLIFVSFWKLTKIVLKAVLLMAVAHGFCSSILFYLVKVWYQKSGSRNILLNRGSLFLSGSLLFFWFFSTFIKASLPPRINYFSEIVMLYKVVSSTWLCKALGGIFIVLIVFLKGLFKVFLFIWIFHGKWSCLKNFWCCFRHRDSLIRILHLIWLIILLIFKNLLF
jgi:NADH:ubiquinone oxidoreductase subunit 4 (subunit M)